MIWNLVSQYEMASLKLPLYLLLHEAPYVWQFWNAKLLFIIRAIYIYGIVYMISRWLNNGWEKKGNNIYQTMESRSIGFRRHHNIMIHAWEKCFLSHVHASF